MPRHPKSAERRAREVQNLTQQLKSVGLPSEVVEPVEKDMAEFAETGQSITKTYAVPGTPIVIQCVLSNQAHVHSRMRITSDVTRRRPGARS